MTRSDAELLLATQLEQAGIGFLREVQFIEGRKFRADFVVLTMPRLIIEVEGAVYAQGRHTRGAGFESGCEKQALAVIAGFNYLRVTPRQVNDGTALSWIKQALGLKERAA